MSNDLLDVFEFKSLSKYFWKECNDIKNNAVRVIDLQDNRFLDLIAWNQLGFNDGDIQIKLVCDDIFIIRDIRDICIFNDMIIITWNPKSKEES